MKTIDIFPIKWFGNRQAYEQSKIRVVTVGLNPSDKEFREEDGEEFTSELRFPEFNPNNEATLEHAFNCYYDRNPYSWFMAFEHILNGMNVSYYHGKDSVALHTDICSPWATVPTWSKLKSKEKKELIKDGFPEWKRLIDELKPDVILFSIPDAYIKMLDLDDALKETLTYSKTKDGTNRKKPIVITASHYHGALCIFGKTRNVPFGALGTKLKQELGAHIASLFPK